MPKKIVFEAAALILLMVVIEAKCNRSIMANPATITVPSPGYETIQKAVNAANPRDTIMVTAGIYHENLIVNKTISLIGEDPTTTIIDGSSVKDVVIINSQGVTIDGFTIRNGKQEWPYCGLRVYTCNFITINNTILKDNFFGLQLLQSNDCKIFNTVISNNLYAGVTLSGSSNNVFSQNMIMNNSFGFQSTNSPSNIFYHNNFINNTRQLWIDDNSTPTILDNEAEGNYWSDYLDSDLNMDAIGDSKYASALAWDNHPLMGIFKNFTFFHESQMYFLSTISNSTTFNFHLDELHKKISFDVSGSNGTIGFCRVAMPAVLAQGNYSVLLDGNTPAYFRNWTFSTCIYSYLVYEHTGIAQKVTIMLEFPRTAESPLTMVIMMILTFLLIAAMFIVAILRRNKRRKF
jgi:parallel beta-helix repeat protein